MWGQFQNSYGGNCEHRSLTTIPEETSPCCSNTWNSVEKAHSWPPCMEMNPMAYSGFLAQETVLGTRGYYQVLGTESLAARGAMSWFHICLPGRAGKTRSLHPSSLPLLAASITTPCRPTSPTCLCSELRPRLKTKKLNHAGFYLWGCLISFGTF